MSTVVKDLGAVSAYAYAVEKGYTGTEAEFAELMADYAEVGQRAEDAANSALESKTAAQTAATTATTKASEASTSATNAAGSASSAASSATAASGSATSAAASATTASGKASEAATAATTATTAKTDAVAAKTAAETAQTAAETAQGAAEDAAQDAEDSAESIAASASQIAQNTSDISELKEEITDKVDTADMLKAFPVDTASGSIASFSDGAELPLKSLTVDIEPVQDGTGDPSPDNVRPISGHTQAVVTRTGVNVWDGESEDGYYDISNNGVKVSSSSWKRSKNFIPCIPEANYYFMTAYTGSDSFGALIFYDANGNMLSYKTSGIRNSVFATPQNCRYIGFYAKPAWFNANLSINSTSTDHEYHAYSGQNITIPLGQTVYGGTLDVLSGELVIEKAMVDLGTLDWSYSASNTVFYVNFAVGAADGKCICTIYRNRTTASASNDKSIMIGKTGWYVGNLTVRDSDYTDATAFKAAVTGQTLVYELATPITVTLTPNELSTLLGANNIWSDAGKVTAEYRADPTLYIQRLTEPDVDMVADSNITSGSYFMVGNTLYKATANIASGATISPNVNCTRKSLSEALNELNA